MGPELTAGEVADVATAVIGLTDSPIIPDHDLALIWAERLGWALAVHIDPCLEFIPVCYLGESVDAAVVIEEGGG